ncbi:hypothetical protein llap_13060 [Limosa lapponica baueri]|uniref:Uncharacterized protein n=1 Tax=Limosa lapponica baueri TaxID=1758121 RepID=A0A2I0TS48_LIMLA|nr:hypothetical protein llap_13060 [Limosa lapponica baueri]
MDERNSGIKRAVSKMLRWAFNLNNISVFKNSGIKEELDTFLGNCSKFWERCNSCTEKKIGSESRAEVPLTDNIIGVTSLQIRGELGSTNNETIGTFIKSLTFSTRLFYKTNRFKKFTFVLASELNTNRKVTGCDAQVKG